MFGEGGASEVSAWNTVPAGTLVSEGDRMEPQARDLDSYAPNGALADEGYRSIRLAEKTTGKS